MRQEFDSAWREWKYVREYVSYVKYFMYLRSQVDGGLKGATRERRVRYTIWKTKKQKGIVFSFIFLRWPVHIIPESSYMRVSISVVVAGAAEEA